MGSDETLLRRLHREWLTEDGDLRSGVDQAKLITLPQCSFDCDRLGGTYAEVLSRSTTGEDTGLAAVGVAAIPPTFAHPASAVVYESNVVLCPENRNAAHSEVRISRVGFVEEATAPGSKAFKKKIRAEIAATLRVVHPPQVEPQAGEPG